MRVERYSQSPVRISGYDAVKRWKNSRGIQLWKSALHEIRMCGRRVDSGRKNPSRCRRQSQYALSERIKKALA